jgi:predicted DsbA family dithiol-disulfide isomerase
VIADRYLVMGAQPYPVFEQVMATAGAARRTAHDS